MYKIGERLPEGYPYSPELVEAARKLLEERKEVIKQMEEYLDMVPSSIG